MPYDRPELLSISLEAADDTQTTWAWAIRREPGQMLMVRSRPEYAKPDQALQAARIAAKRVSRNLRIPLAINDSGHGDRIVTAHDVWDAPIGRRCTYD